MKVKKHEPKVKPADHGDDVAAPETVAETKSANITCSYGIHRGNFPVAGMKVKDARAVLKKLIKVDDKAAAVINGQVVGEDDVISSETTLLSFVKPSAVKGAITIDGEFVQMDSKQVKVDKFCGLVSQNTISGLHEAPIPDNVKWVARAGQLEVYIIELKPELRSIKWIADYSPEPYGPEAEYEQRRLATPYVIIKVPVLAGQVQHVCELFYSNEPLRSIDHELCFPNLYNVSPNIYRVKSWFCTQYLDVKGLTAPNDILTEVINHVWGGGFNKSSDAHENTSGFALCKSKRIDKRVTDVNAWEQASCEDPRFVLDVKWPSAGTTVRDRLQSDLNMFNVATVPNNSNALGSILLRSRLLV